MTTLVIDAQDNPLVTEPEELQTGVWEPVQKDPLLKKMVHFVQNTTIGRDLIIPVTMSVIGEETFQEYLKPTTDMSLVPPRNFDDTLAICDARPLPERLTDEEIDAVAKEVFTDSATFLSDGMGQTEIRGYIEKMQKIFSLNELPWSFIGDEVQQYIESEVQEKLNENPADILTKDATELAKELMTPEFAEAIVKKMGSSIREGLDGSDYDEVSKELGDVMTGNLVDAVAKQQKYTKMVDTGYLQSVVESKILQEKTHALEQTAGDIQKQIDQQTSAISQTKAEQEELNKQITELDEKIAKAEGEEKSALEIEKEQLNDKIAQTEAELNSQEQEREATETEKERRDNQDWSKEKEAKQKEYESQQKEQSSKASQEKGNIFGGALSETPNNSNRDFQELTSAASATAKSSILAKYDMVLSISENTINSQLNQLLQKNILEKDWKLLVKKDSSPSTVTGQGTITYTKGLANVSASGVDFNSVVKVGQQLQCNNETRTVVSIAPNGQQLVVNQPWATSITNAAYSIVTAGTYTIKTQADADFDTVLDAWQAAQQDLATLFAQKNFSEYGTKLAFYTKEGVLFDYGWVGTINAPSIQVIQDTTQELLFKISFAAGTLYYSDNIEYRLARYDLANILYAFRCPIGRLQIDSTDKIITPEAQKQAKEVIRHSGLTDADFTIESLFMDFDDANISNFDQTSSKFPAYMTIPLKVTVEDYFKLVLSKSSNPYILGYGMSANNSNSASNPKALFQPTAVRYSTSYSTKPGCNAFNFLMTVGKDTIPSDQDAGILPNSLLEQTANPESIDGIFAIDYGVFNAIFLEPFIRVIQSKISNGFGNKVFSENAQQWSLVSTSYSQRSVDEPPSDMMKSTRMRSTLDLNAKAKIASINSQLQFNTIMIYSLYIDIQCWELLHAGYHTEAEYWLSTSGKYQKGPQQRFGQIGNIDISISTGTDGKFAMNITSTTPPYLGYDKKSHSNHGGAGIWGVIASDWNDFSDQDAEKASLDAAQKIGPVVENVINSLQSQIDSVNNGKVILPLGELYNFDNIRLYTTENTNDNPILLDLKYTT